MSSNELQPIADAVLRLARRRGTVTPLQVREKLTAAGLDTGRWKEVVALARPALRYRGGKYHLEAGVSERVRQEQDLQRAIHRAVRRLVKAHRQVARTVERREQDRVDFIQPVRVRLEDGREYSLLSRDISPSGLRLIGTRRLLGQKVCVLFPRPGGADAPAPGPAEWSFLVPILWTCAVGDDLFENGGAFIEVAPAGS